MRGSFVLLAVLASAAASAQSVDAPVAAAFNLDREDISSFVDEVVSRDGLKRTDVRALLKQAQPQPKILEIMTRPPERFVPWWEYRERFLTAERINDGAHFWLDHKLALEQIALEYQVPPEYLVAIVGVESFYGRITGHYRVLDALATLAFDYPPRHGFFRGELEQFLLLAKENGLDALNVTGSYGGAMGAPQFMPSAYRRYAVDANTHKPIDLWTDWDGILASVALYLHEAGWTPGGAVLADAQLDPEPSFQIDPHNVELNETVEGLGAHGVRVDAQVAGDVPVVLVSAEQRDGPSYRVGFHNFYVITRYNHSARYAMAVNDLAQAIAQRVLAAPL
ncbi:MAG TPA: lytic murein transglycosylase B [Steroidobacteraceae bacterium]|nr:lytic murein transglycosylase B [Steroidobacteraceae bacterium]